jgi:outer membrane protein
MKKIIIATAVGLLVAGQVAAQESPWMVRARAVNVASVDNNGTSTANLAVKDKTIPEVDVTYFFNKNVAAELVLTVPQEMTVSAGANVGTFKALPPTLTLQYHFTNFNGYKPYVGAGLNYTKITHQNIGTIPVTKQVSLNFDIKKVQIKTDVYSGTTNTGTLKLDPTLIGVGVGYRF